MAAQPSNSDALLEIIKLLAQDMELETGGVVQELRLRELYRASGGKSEDITPALHEACDREWLSYDRLSDSYSLTAEGWQAGVNE